MQLGLSKEKIIEKLMENEDVISESLFEKIAEVIVENNKTIERNVTNFVSGELNKKIRTRY